MSNPTLTISIDRTGMAGSPAALTFSGTPGVGERGITAFTEPRLQVRRETINAPDIHGERLRSWSWQQAILGWDFVLDAAASEDEVDALVDETRAALSRMLFAVTVVKNGGTPQVWSCQVGEVNLSGPRTYADLVDHNPTLQVTIPCHPVRS